MGYSIRFDDQTSEKTVLRYLTDGILVRECLQDKDLKKYDLIILDEAHERSLYTDVLFALVKHAVMRRGGHLKLVVTSATLNTDQFSKYFNNCPVLKMKGRTYPVEIKYGPCLANKRIEESVTAALRMHLHEGRGDILVFLTGSEECELGRRICFQKLQELKESGKVVADVLIYALYGAQSSDEQSNVFKKAGENQRKIIFSTNIAETSLTIDGIGFVIDSGYVKQKCYNPRTGMDALIVVPISKIQAMQRTGRAGRTQAGKCYRLYSEKFYQEEMQEFTIPEILRVNLSNVILNLKNMSIDDVLNFDYMERPENEAILCALRQLYFLGAIDVDGKITDLGNEMCRFPLEPSYSKALISSVMMKCEEDMITLVSLLSSEHIWSKPPRIKEDEYKLFERKLVEFADLDGDHHSMLKIYKRWKKSGFSEKFCRENFLNSRALKQAENIKVQVTDLVKGMNRNLCKQSYKSDSIYKLYKSAKILERDFLPRHADQCTAEETLLLSTTSKQKEEGSSESKPDTLTPSEVFRLSLFTGFFFNSARKIINKDGSYILVYPEGNVVDVDPQSVYVSTNFYPNFVIFTELGGTSILRGVIRLLSAVAAAWIKLYMKKTEDVDMFRLGGMPIDSKQVLLERKKEMAQKEKEEESKQD